MRKIWQEICLWVDDFLWSVAQSWSYRFGKRKENVTVDGKDGFLFQNLYNKSIWFHPYDNSYFCKTPRFCDQEYLKEHFFR